MAKQIVNHDVVIQRIKEDWSYTEIANEEKCSRERIRQIAKIYGLVGFSSLEKSRQRYNDLLQAVKDEEDPEVAIVRLNIPQLAARNFLVKNGFGVQSKLREAIQQELTPLVERVRQGESIRRACGENRVLEQRVRRECKRLGVKSKHGRWTHKYDKLLQVAKRGGNIKLVIKRSDLKPINAHDFLSRNRLGISKTSQEATQQKLEPLVERVRQGESIYETSGKNKALYKKIYNECKRLGVKSKHQIAHQNDPLYEKIKIDKDVVVKLIKDKLPYAEIAQTLSCNKSNIYRIANRLGIPKLEREERRQEISPLVKRVRRGESIRSVCGANKALYLQVKNECKRLGIKSKHQITLQENATKRRA